MKQPATYIMASGHNGTLYTDVTSQPLMRVHQHKQGTFGGFTSNYGCTQLVWFELYDEMTRAIEHEKQIKSWSRKKKLMLIEGINPDWADLSGGLA